MATNKVDFSNAAVVIDMIGGKWDIEIISALFSGTMRFSEILLSVRGIQRKVLTDRLQHLEQHGIIYRKKYPIVPPRVDYPLTEVGRSLKPILTQLNEWGKEYRRSTL